jgi:hypothetical protein
MNIGAELFILPKRPPIRMDYAGKAENKNSRNQSECASRLTAHWQNVVGLKLPLVNLYWDVSELTRALRRGLSLSVAR